jgi:hypothetical protein
LARWLLIVVAAAALVLARLAGPALGSAVREETLVRAGWGEDEGQLGRYRGLDDKWYGPQSFALAPDGALFVLDTYNHRVVVFGASGMARATFAIPSGGDTGLREPPYADDIAIDGLGRVYLADNRNLAVLAFDLDGRLIGVYHSQAPAETAAAAPAAAWYGRIEGLWPAADEGVFVDELWLGPSRAIRSLRLYSGLRSGSGKVGAVVTPAGSAAGGYTSLAVSRGRCYLDTPPSQESGPRTITVLDERGRRLRTVTISSGAAAGPAVLFGLAGDGRLYFGRDLSRRPVAEIIVATRRGAIANIIRLPGSPISVTHPARVSTDGGFHLMRCSESGVELVRVTFKPGAGRRATQRRGP